MYSISFYCSWAMGFCQGKCRKVQVRHNSKIAHSASTYRNQGYTLRIIRLVENIRGYEHEMHKLWITTFTRKDDDKLPPLWDTDRFGEEISFTRSATTISRNHSLAIRDGARFDGTCRRGTIGV